MNSIRKSIQNGSMKTVVIILSLAIGICSGFLAFRNATELLTVRADETADVSPTQPDEASAVESVSPSDAENYNVVTNHGAKLIPMADPSPQEIPLYVTHDLTMNDGTVVSSAYPAGAYTDVLGTVKSMLNGESKLDVSFDRSVASSQPGVFYYGHDMQIYLYKLQTNYNDSFQGSVTLHLSDGTDLNWPVSSASSYGSSMTVPSYYGNFKWSSVADAIGERSVTSITVNQINAFNRGATLTINRHSSVPVRIEAYAPNAWDYFYSRELDQYSNWGIAGYWNVLNGKSSAAFSDDTTTSFAVTALKGGRFVLSTDSDTVSITEVRLYDGNGYAMNSANYVTQEDGKYVVTFPTYSTIVDVITSDVTPHKVTVEATSPDLTLNAVAVTDSYDFNSFYQIIYKARYSDADCTESLTNGSQYPRVQGNAYTSDDGKTVTFSNYHQNQVVNYFMSLICYDRKPDTYYSSNYNSARVTEMTSLKFIRDSDGADVTSEILNRTDYKSGSPYVEFQPPAYDVTVKITQKMKSDMHTITIKETRPTTKDTTWENEILYADSSLLSPLYLLGKSVETSLDTGSPVRFPSGETERVTTLGYFRAEANYKYKLMDGNYTHYDNATMVESVKFYNADTNVEVDVGLTFDGTTDADYYQNIGLKQNKPVFEQAEFTMPKCNLRVEVVYGKTIRAWKIKQQIVTSDGSSTPADSSFSVTFNGTPRDDDTTAFIYGTTADNQASTDSFTASGAEFGCGVYRGTTNIQLTPAPAAGYVVSYIKVMPLLYTDQDYGSSLTRSGDTFSIPNSLFTGDTDSSYKGPMYEITVSYTKAAIVRLEQRADGSPAPLSSTVVGTVTLSSQNNGTFLDPASTSNNNLSKTYANKLLEGDDTDGNLAKSSLVYASAGNKLTVKVKINTNGSRVLSKVVVRRTNSDTPLDMTLSSSGYDNVEYKLNETLAENDDITIEVEYMTAHHIKMEVLEKDPATESSMLTNTTTAYAEVTGTNAATTERGYQFIKSSNRSVTCDSFTVQNTVEDYLTTGQTKLSVRIKDIPAGYVVANVETSFITSSGTPGQHAEGLMPSSQNLEGYGICYDYSQCTVNTAERNLYIRVYLAKTAEVTVRFRSRSDLDDAVFEDNAVTNTYATFEHNNACYGSGTIYPVIVENVSGSKYNTGAYTVTNDPSVRHVYAIDRVKMTGTISMPEDYTIASVVATRTKDGVTETLSPQLSNYLYKTENDVPVYQAKFALPQQLNNGYAYEITVYIEKITSVTLKMYHSTEQREFVPNTLTGSYATLSGARGDESGLYSGDVYKSDVPFHSSSRGSAAPTASVKVTSSAPEVNCYVLRHTGFSLAVKPVSNDEVYEVKAFDPDGDTYDCTYTETDANGNLIYSVTQNGSPVQSRMFRNLVFEVYFADKRTEGTLIVENRDYISGELLEDVGMVSLRLSNPLYTLPARVLPDGGTVGDNAAVNGSTASYAIITGTRASLYSKGQALYRLYCYTEQIDDGEIQTRAVSKDNNYYEKSLNITEDGTIKIVNYYLKAAEVTGTALYTDSSSEQTQLRPDIRNRHAFDSVAFYCTPKKDDENLSHESMSTGYEASAVLLTGESTPLELEITELAGYTLETLKLECEGVGTWTLTRDQITSVAVPPTGDNVIQVDFSAITKGSLTDAEFALLKETFASLQGGKHYTAEATFTADIIHIKAYEMSLDDFLIMDQLGLYEYQRRYSGLGYHSPKRVVNAGASSIDGSTNDVYYSSNYLANYEEYDIGVRRGSTPTCTVNYQFKVERSSGSSHYEYYRVGAVYYGQTESTQMKQRILFDDEQPPLPVGFCPVITLDPITDDSYMTVIYVLSTADDIKVPEVHEETYSSTDTVVKNTRLTVNLYCYNEELDGYEPITDPSMLNEIAATLKVEQTCVGYRQPSSSESAKTSDADHHANYVPDNPEEAIIYHHDALPVLYRYNWEEDRFDTVVEALVADEMDGTSHPTHHTVKSSTVPVNAANSLYAVKYNNIDRVHVVLDATIPETYNLQKMEINQNGTITTRNDSCAYHYETADGGNVTVSYYFGRPILEVGTNNDTDAPKGSVRMNGATVIKDTDYMQAMSFHAGDPIVLVIEPNEGYRFDYIRAGASRSGDMAYVTGNDKISQEVVDGKVITTVNLGTWTRNIYVQIQFSNDDQEDLAQLTVNQFLMNSSNEPVPITDGKVVIIGTGSGGEKPLRIGDTKENTLTLKDAESLSAHVLAGTKLEFTLNAPAGYELAASPFEASYQEKNDNTQNAIAPEHTEGSKIYTVPLSYVQKDRAITVNVYFSPRYRLLYDGNSHTGGTPPTESKTYAPHESEENLKGDNGLTRTGYTFGGWSLSKTEPEQVTSVTFADEDITLYAIWLPKATYTVTYHSEGHTGSVPVDTNSPYYDGESVHVLGKGEMARGEYTFSGWDTDPSADTVVYVPYDSNSPQTGSYFTIDHDTDLYAVWTAPEYTVTYDGNGVEGAPVDANSPYTLGSEVTVLGQGNLQKTGYSFQGWSLTSGADNSVDYSEGDKFSIDRDTTLYAVWKVETYYVYYSLTVPDDVNYTYEDDLPFAYGADVSVQEKPGPANYTVPGKYTFDGWNNADTDLNMNAAGTAFVMPAHDVYFYGSFNVNGQANLIYNANGGLPADKVPASQSGYGALSTTVEDMPSDCTRTGYEFDHWNTAADDSGDSYTDGQAIEVPEGTTTVLYAQWNICSFNVEYYDIDGYAEGKQPLKTDVYEYRQSVTVGALAPELDGKKFRQWALVKSSQTDADGTEIGESTTFAMPAETVRYKAVYDNLQYQVLYVYTGTEPADAPALPTDSTLYGFGGDVTVKPVPTAPAGYRFDGWKLGGSNTTGFTINASTPVSAVAGNDLLRTVTLTGVWARESEVNITYTSGLSGNEITDESLRTVKTDTCVKGQDYTLRHNEGFTDYVRPGYEFVGWKITASGSHSSPTGYLKSFLRAVAPKLFYSDDTVYAEGAVMDALDGDLTLAAVWQQNEAPTYTVTYHGNGNDAGEPPTDDGQYTAGTPATVLGPSTLQKTGCEFDGWTTESDGGDHYNQGETLTVNADVHLYAKWKPSGDTPDDPQTKYRVFYDGNGSTGGNVPEDRIEYLPGKKVTVLPQGNLEKKGYTFEGWNTQADGKGTTYKPGKKFSMGNANVTLYAVWKARATTDSPGTGESGLPLAIAFSALLLSAAAFAVILIRRRRKA